MKKLFALTLLSGFFALTSCDSGKKTSESQEVIETDTTEATYEVEKTVVETDTTITSDTTTKTEDVKVEEEKK